MCDDCTAFEEDTTRREDIDEWVSEQRAKLDSMMADLAPVGGNTPNANLVRGYAAGYQAALSAVMAEHGWSDSVDAPGAHLSAV